MNTIDKIEDAILKLISDARERLYATDDSPIDYRYDDKELVDAFKGQLAKIFKEIYSNGGSNK